MKEILVVLSVASLLAGGAVMADTASEIRQLILDQNAKQRKTLKGEPGLVSKDGAVEFWSSGGLAHTVQPDAPPAEYDMMTVRPKHIKVITLVEGKAAVAMYYSEGAMKPKGAPAVNHYMTRAMVVYVNEGGKWKVRASHWSPIQAGAGTSQTSLD